MIVQSTARRCYEGGLRVRDLSASTGTAQLDDGLHNRSHALEVPPRQLPAAGVERERTAGSAVAVPHPRRGFAG